MTQDRWLLRSLETITEVRVDDDENALTFSNPYAQQLKQYDIVDEGEEEEESDGDGKKR